MLLAALLSRHNASVRLKMTMIVSVVNYFAGNWNKLVTFFKYLIEDICSRRIFIERLISVDVAL